MASDMSLLALFANASITVKLVMLTLFLLSIFSWAFIFQRYKVFKTAKEITNTFEKKFWSGIDLNAYYSKILVDQDKLTGQEAIFAAGFREFLRLHKQCKVAPDQVMDGVDRAMNIVIVKETEKLEQKLPFLATVQSMSPYIGLFGTVWGIMHSFRQLSGASQATIAMVAPGISEALIATAMGLIAAIPAGIAYNRYVNKVDKLSGRYQLFAEELKNLLYRTLYSEALKANVDTITKQNNDFSSKDNNDDQEKYQSKLRDDNGKQNINKNEQEGIKEEKNIEHSQNKQNLEME